MPWSGEVAFLPTARRIFEYACHEDNSAIEGGLRGAREREGEEALRRQRSSGALLGAERGNRKIWRTWLPDIFLNPHGYPSHEWVQLFSEYDARVRTRSVETRDYWTMRGWWMPGFVWLDDARYPRHKDEQMKLLNMITEYAKAAPGPDPPTYLTHPTHPTYSTYLTPVKSPACQPWLRIARRRACAKPTGCVVPTRTCQREGMGSR